jgi:hypothetical protein
MMGLAFALAYGAGNGLLTIVRGTLRLVLFDPRSHGALTGRLQGPSFYVAALAPIVYAATIHAAGPEAALYLSLGQVASCSPVPCCCSCGSEIRERRKG